MVTPTTGEVVLVPFPFSDLSQNKVRPAVCLADAGRGDWVLCQITSSPYGDPAAVPLDASDFASGSKRVRKFLKTWTFPFFIRSVSAVLSRLRAQPTNPESVSPARCRTVVSIVPGRLPIVPGSLRLCRLRAPAVPPPPARSVPTSA